MSDSKRGRPKKKVEPQDIEQAPSVKRKPNVISSEQPPKEETKPMENNTPPPNAPESHADFSAKAQETIAQEQTNTPPSEPTPSSAPKSDWDPVTTEPVINRGYGTSQSASPSGAGQAIADIPEPRFSAPTAESILNEPPPPEPKGDPIIPPNPGMNDLSSGDKRKAAEAAVEFIFKIWQWLNDFGRKKSKIDMKEVQKLHDQLKIDMNMVIPRNGRPVTFKDVVDDFNNQTEELFIVTEKFKEEVREPMVREFLRRNIGLTDLQKIGAYWAMEAAQKIAQFIQTKNLGNSILAELQEIKASQDRKNRPQAPTGQAQAGTPPPPPSGSANNTTPPASSMQSDIPITPSEEYSEPEENKQ